MRVTHLHYCWHAMPSCMAACAPLQVFSDVDEGSYEKATVVGFNVSA